MAPGEIFNWIEDCDGKVEDSKHIAPLLKNAEFIQFLKRKLIAAFREESSYGGILSQLTFLLRHDERFKHAVSEDCGGEFLKKDLFIWFCYWCSTIAYNEINTRISTERGEEE